MTPFATVSDYELRYGAADCPERIGALLADASAYIASQPGFSDPAESDEVAWANLRRVTCAVVNRAVPADGLGGVDTYSQGGIGYTASVKLSNPTGDYYLTKAERASLGLAGGRVGMTDPYGCGADDDA